MYRRQLARSVAGLLTGAIAWLPLTGRGRTESTADVPTEPDSSPDPLSVDGYQIHGEDPDEEYVRLRNVGTQRLDATGWTLEDDGLVPAGTLSPFTFPAGFTLESDATVTIVTGEGEDTDETLYWGVDRQVWAEGGDVVFVFDADGDRLLEQPIAG